MPMTGSRRRWATSGYRVIVPYLRGYGPTRFLDPAMRRSGQQAALGHDLLDLIDALDLRKPILAGYDWGGRAACIVAALWPERVGGLVSINGYIQDIANSGRPAPPAAEHRRINRHSPDSRADEGHRLALAAQSASPITDVLGSKAEDCLLAAPELGGLPSSRRSSAGVVGRIRSPLPVMLGRAVPATER